MILGAPFGLVPFGAGPEWDAGIIGTYLDGGGTLDASPLDARPRLSMLEDMSRTAVHVVMISAWHIEDAEAVLLTYSDHEFISGEDDLPANASFDGLVKGGHIERDLMRPHGFGGLVDGRGEVLLENRDGGLDALEATYALAGRPVEIRTGLLGDRVEDMMPIFAGTVYDLYTDDEGVRLLIRDRAEELEVPLTTQTYAGTGGAEGTGDLYLKRKPLIFGEVYHFAPVLVDPARNIYQLFSDASFDNVAGYIYVNGAQVNTVAFYVSYASFAASAPPAGYSSFTVADWTAVFVRLGSVPNSQVVTASVAKVDETDFGNIRAVKASAVADIAKSAAGYTWADDFDQATFNAHMIAQPYRIGLYVDQNDDSTAAETIDRICGERSFVTYGRNGLLRMGLVALPGANAVVALDEASIFAVDTPRWPDGLSARVWRWRLGWAKRWIADMAGRVASSVSEIVRAFLAEPVRYAGYQAPTLKDAYRLAKDRTTLDDLFVDYIEATIEGEALYALYSTGRRLYRIECARSGLVVEPGDTFAATDARFGLAAGKKLTSVGDHYDFATRRVTLTGLG